MSEYDIPPKSLGDDIDEWTRARLGKATASNIWKVVKRTKSGWSAERHNYKIELIAERLTGMRQDVFLNQAMLHGVETQPDAERAYAASTGFDIYTPTLFVDHSTIKNAG